MKLKIVTGMLLATMLAAPASAGPLANAWDRQQVAIGNGVANGSLNPGEAIRLEQRAQSIKNQYQFFKSTGGGLGPAERAFLGARLIGARAAIFYHKHN
jgi:hypothetical protein